MPTDLCRYCGSTYDLVHGHTCTPTITVANTGPTAVAGMTPVRVQCVGHPGTTPPCSWTGTYTLGDPVDEGHCPTCDGLLQAVADPPPDLQQAIHAATMTPTAAAAVLQNLLSIAQVEELSGYQLENDPINAALKMAMDALGQLQAAQAENQQLRDQLEYVMAVTTPECEVCEDDAETVTLRNGAQMLACQPCADAIQALEHQAALGQVERAKEHP